MRAFGQFRESSEGQRKMLECRLGQAMKDLAFHAKGFGPHPVLEGRARSCQSSKVSLDLREVWLPI